MDRVVVPMHGNNHWTLLVLNVQAMQFSLSNSMPGIKNRDQSRVQQAIAILGVGKGYQTVECPMQEANERLRIARDAEPSFFVYR